MLPAPQPLPRTVDLFFPGFRWDSVLVKLSLTELLAFLVERLLSGGDPTLCTLLSMGASSGAAKGELWRLSAPIFLHGNLGHLITNLLFQLRLGFKVENLLGPKRFLALYLLSGTFGPLSLAFLSSEKHLKPFKTC